MIWFYDIIFILIQYWYLFVFSVHISRWDSLANSTSWFESQWIAMVRDIASPPTWGDFIFWIFVHVLNSGIVSMPMLCVGACSGRSRSSGWKGYWFCWYLSLSHPLQHWTSMSRAGVVTKHDPIQLSTKSSCDWMLGMLCMNWKNVYNQTKGNGATTIIRCFWLLAMVWGRECLRLQGLSFQSLTLDNFSEAQLTDLAGNACLGHKTQTYKP